MTFSYLNIYSGTRGTARDVLRGTRPGEHCSSGMGGGTPRAAQQLFSSVDKNAHYGAMLRGTLAHRDVRAHLAWAPQEMPAEHISLKILIRKLL
jgi:hypothetical protein